MSEISAGGMTFKKGEIISYEVEKGAPREFIVVDKSKDIDKNKNSLPGLILRNTTNNRQFAINAASVATRVKKIPQPEKERVPPEETSSIGSAGSGYSQRDYGGPVYSAPSQRPSPNYAYNQSPGNFRKFVDFVKPKGGKRSDSEGGSSRLAFEFLILLAIAVHIADAFWLSFSISSMSIGYRTFMYFVLCIFAHFILNKGWSVKDSMIELIKVSAIPLFVVPFISIILSWFTVPDVVVETISALTLAFPVWLFYIMYVRGERINIEGTFWNKAVNLLFTPSGWARIWFFVLVLAILFNMITLMGVTVSSIPGADISGFDVKTSADVLVTFFATTYDKMAASTTSFVKSVVFGYETMKNETLGDYYTGQVEQNKELTGIFITDFHVDGKQYDSMPIMAYGYIRARSFVEGISIKTSCYAQSSTNKSVIYQGKTDPLVLDNIYIEDQRGVLCSFEDNVNEKGGLPAGRYQIFLVLDFNFETWAYKQYYFIDRNYLVYLKTSGENPNTKLSIPQKTTTVYTNGPVMIGMDDKLEMPFAISTENTNYLPIGMTIDNKPPTYGAKGEVLKVNKYTLRLPDALTINKNACTVSEDYISGPAPDNISGYTLYSFNIPENSLAGTYMTLNCNLNIGQDEVQKIIPGANTPAIVSVIGTVAYDYRLSKMISVTVEKTPGT